MNRRRYCASFSRGVERRTFYVLAYNKDEAYVEAVKQLEASGEKVGGPGKDWWYVGAELEFKPTGRRSKGAR